MQNEEQSLSLDAKILAEFERLVLEGHRREIAERLVCNLLGRTALGNRGLTRAAIHGLVMESKVKKPKKTETVTEVEAETKAGTVTELATEAFNAEAIWEPKETHEGRYNLLVEALKNARNAGTPLNIDVASEILKAILAEGSHRNLPAAKAEATTDVPFEASAEAETVPVPALIKLEAEVTRAFERVRESSWDWAVALCAIHDSRLYPDSASAGSWERYTKLRWKLERAQSYRLVAWVHHEISLVPALEEPETQITETSVSPGILEEPEEKPTVASGLLGRILGPQTASTSADAAQSPAQSVSPGILAAAPDQPVHKNEKASRAARSKPRSRKIRGKLNEDDLAEMQEAGTVVPVEGTTEVYARTEADRRVSEGTLAKVEGKYYDPSARTGDWFLLSIEDPKNPDRSTGLLKTYPRSRLVHCITDFRINNLLSVRGANKRLEIGSSRTASASKDGSLAKDKSRRCAPCQGNSAAGDARALSKDHAFGRMRLGVYYALEEAF
jgi:hypothetical protein